MNGSNDYPEDWREQGWCCRDCAVLAWNSMSPEMRELFTGDQANGESR